MIGVSKWYALQDGKEPLFSVDVLSTAVQCFVFDFMLPKPENMPIA